MRRPWTEIPKKSHYIFRIPYIILRLRPGLKIGAKHLLTEKELTEFLNEAILVLKEELYNGYLTEQEYQNYVTLFRFAVNRVLMRHPQLQKEVNQMTEPLIKLPSVIVEEMLAERLTELQDEITNQKNEIAHQKNEIAHQQAEIDNQQAKIADQKTQIAEKDDEIRRLRELLSQLSPDDHTP